MSGIHNGRGLLATHLVISAGGHISVMRGNENRCDFLDLGPVLQIAHASTELSPALARKLGRQLINWADNKTPSVGVDLPHVGDTCCGQCGPGLCYVDGVTGA